MRALALALVFAWSTTVFAADFKLDPKIHDTTKIDFVPHDGDGPWGSYLVETLPFEPAADLFKQLLLGERRELANRGEAHVTVVTPVEYWNVLKPGGISISDIDQLAQSEKIQAAKFEVVCFGHGRAKVDGADEETFFIIVKSPDLIAIRAKIRDLFVSKGGDAKKFDPANFHPHITIGFTKRDLHEADGVVKDEKSCFGRLSR